MTHVIQTKIRGGSRIAACTSARTAAHPSTIVMVGRNHQAQQRKLPGTLLPVCRRLSDGAPVSFGRCAERHLGTKAPISTQPVHYRPVQRLGCLLAGGSVEARESAMELSA